MRQLQPYTALLLQGNYGLGRGCWMAGLQQPLWHVSPWHLPIQSATDVLTYPMAKSRPTLQYTFSVRHPRVRTQSSSAQLCLHVGNLSGEAQIDGCAPWLESARERSIVRRQRLLEKGEGGDALKVRSISSRLADLAADHRPHLIICHLACSTALMFSVLNLRILAWPSGFVGICALSAMVRAVLGRLWLG